MNVAVKKIIQYMQRHGLSKIMLAERIGMNRSQITRCLAGDFTPSLGFQKRINRVFGINNDWIDSP
ncbi:MAG: helix-turn-helix transcriptional regulator [Spirochaetales bacterium]|nr:helix-turn-helix transcriptional regulator [Spirochaetales bacterium]